MPEGVQRRGGGRGDRRGFSAAVTDDPVFGDTAQLERL